VLVTGAGGFVGQHVVRRFMAAGDQVVAVETPDGERRVPNDVEATLDASDLRRSLAAGQPIADTADLVVHLGAITDTTLADPTPYRTENVEWSQLIAASCSADGVPLVYASSAAVYGAAAECSERPPNERPLNAYGQSKLDVDNFVRGTASSHSTPVTGLRFFNVYGPGEGHKGRMASMVHQGAQQVRTDGELRLFGASHGVDDGGHARDFIFVSDVVDVVWWAAATGSGVRILNCGTGAARTFRELGEAVIAALGAGTIRYIPFPAALTEVYQAHTCADLNDLRGAGYTGEFTDLSDGVLATVTAGR
ncbi:MAG: NAD-dependent epimerase/dehydratase family protein, partial [Actinomycetes bacterium]